jgi:hypothetical protein
MKRKEFILGPKRCQENDAGPGFQIASPTPRPIFHYSSCKITSMTTVIINLGLLASLFCYTVPADPVEGFGGCVPSGIDLNSVVAIEAHKPTTNVAARKTTVKLRLIQLKAHCKRGKLVDGKGKQIYLYQLIGCWGNPPEDYQEQLARQNQELQRLKKKYTVVEIPCAQVDPRQIQ